MKKIVLCVFASLFSFVLLPSLSFAQFDVAEPIGWEGPLDEAFAERPGEPFKDGLWRLASRHGELLDCSDQATGSDYVIAYSAEFAASEYVSGALADLTDFILLKHGMPMHASFNAQGQLMVSTPKVSPGSVLPSSAQDQVRQGGTSWSDSPGNSTVADPSAPNWHGRTWSQRISGSAARSTGSLYPDITDPLYAEHGIPDPIDAAVSSPAPKCEKVKYEVVEIQDEHGNPVAYKTVRVKPKKDDDDDNSMYVDPADIDHEGWH